MISHRPDERPDRDGQRETRARTEPPRLRVIQGGGERREEPLGSRDALIRVLVASGADLLLRRISPVRAEEIERRVDEALLLFDRVDRAPALMPVLERKLAELEALVVESRSVRRAGRR